MKEVRLIFSKSHHKDIVYYSENSLMPHICPNEANFKIGTYWIYYYLAPAQALSGFAVVDIAAAMFPVGSKMKDQCSSDPNCLNPEGSVVGNNYACIQ